MGIGREKVDVLPAEAHRHVCSRVFALFAPDWSRLPLGTAVNTAVQSVAPRQLHFARTLWGSARLQTERGFCFRPVRGPRADVRLQGDRVRGSLQAAVQKLVVRVAAQAPSIGSRFCHVPCRAVQLSTQR